MTRPACSDAAAKQTEGAGDRAESAQGDEPDTFVGGRTGEGFGDFGAGGIGGVDSPNEKDDADDKDSKCDGFGHGGRV